MSEIKTPVHYQIFDNSIRDADSHPFCYVSQGYAPDYDISGDTAEARALQICEAINQHESLQSQLTAVTAERDALAEKLRIAHERVYRTTADILAENEQTGGGYGL